MPNETLTRQILDEIDRNPSISQRQLSDKLGVSIGIVNWHMTGTSTPPIPCQGEILFGYHAGSFLA